MFSLPKPLLPLLIAFAVGCGITLAEPVWPQLKFTEVADVTAPVQITHAGDGSGRMFVTGLNGEVWLLENQRFTGRRFLNISSRVLTGGERGLLSIAFPPGYAGKRYFYACYTRKTDGAIVLSRFHVPQATPNEANPASEQVLLTVPHPNDTHQGGQLAFGPDGFLYLGLGDGGPQGDPANNSQNPGLLLGKLLRLSTETSAVPYAIPTTNPFRGKPGYRQEIFALGLRNPWRFSFDRQTGDLYLPDVGQYKWEEMNFVPAGSKGGQNFGWRIMEGTHPYNLPQGYDTSALTPPAFEYPHQHGGSITGGFVYRGPSPALRGFYIFADFQDWKVMLAKREAGNWVTHSDDALNYSISGFGEDEEGRLYAADVYRHKVLEITDDPYVRTPVLLNTGGTFTNAIKVSAISATADAVLRYTTDPSEPTESDPVFPEYGLDVDGNTRLNVRGFHPSLLPGPTATAYYGFAVSDPAISAGSGPVYPEAGKWVGLSSTTKDAVVHYTLDGSVPTRESTVYSSSPGIYFDIGPATVRAIAFKPGYASSKEVSASWIRPTLDTPKLGVINYVSITGNGDLHYTLDGSEPTELSPIFTANVPITEPVLLRARSFRHGYHPSAEASANLYLVLSQNGGSGPASGSGTAGFADSSLWYEAKYRAPEAVCMEDAGSYLVADTGNHAIRRSAIFGPVSTVAGNGTAGFVNAAGAIARFSSPRGICRDAAGNIYVADDENHVIRKIDLAGNVTTYAGSGALGTTSGAAAQAKFLDLQGLAIDATGNLFAGSLGVIRKIDTARNVSDFAVLPNAGRVSVAIDPHGRMFATDGSHVVYEIGADGAVSVFAGGIAGYSDGFRTVARFQNNRSIAADAIGILYVCDGNKVRKIRADGLVFTGHSDGSGSLANLSGPRGLAVGADGTAWIADTGNHRIRRSYPNDWERDGIPDSEEGGATPFVVGADDRVIDTDGDGQPNFVEYAGGSNPRDGASRFEIQSLTQNPNGTLLVRWQSALGRFYQVDFTDDFVSWTPIAEFLRGTGSVMSVSHERGTGKHRFFRISAR